MALFVGCKYAIKHAFVFHDFFYDGSIHLNYLMLRLYKKYSNT